MNESGRTSTPPTTVRERLAAVARLTRNRRVKFALRTTIGLLVLAAVGRHVYQTWQRLHAHGEVLHIDPAWIALGVVVYVAGLAVFGVYFERIMRASATPVGLGPAIRAYLISHLGKYVPGKAMVVLMRVGLVTPFGARGVTAAFATLYETLVMMAGGALIAVVGFLVRPIEPWFAILAGGLAVAFLVVVDPAIFPRISALMTLPFKGVGPDALPRITRRLLVEGLACSAVGWTLLGLSQVAVARGVSSTGVAVADWPLVIASVAFATVAGFVVAVMPGGLGVREGVLMASLQPALGPERAVLAALALRLAWVVGELLSAAVLSVVRPAVPVPLSEVSAP